MRRILLLLAASSGAWLVVVVGLFVYVNRKAAQAAGWLA